ncbi:MAG TPA: hypothetical protein PLS46_19615, partial [Microthrixaceae bacterium]|nr:hypothetical protein [Microthrixaceae bacterium]
MNDLPGNDDESEPNPFGDMSAGLNQIFQLFGGGLGGPGAAPDWDRARQAAAALASEGGSEANVDPLVRIQFEQLARVAELQVAQVTGLTLSR